MHFPCSFSALQCLLKSITTRNPAFTGAAPLTSQQAIKLKGAQMEQQRRVFDSWPAFYQNTLFMNGRVLELRDMAVAERLVHARALKDEGNDRFRQQDFSAAVSLYEKAAGIFRYAKNKDPNWRKRGVRDETIEEVDERGEPGSDVHEQVTSLLVSCYSNLAAAYLGRAVLPRDAEHTSELSGTTSDGDYALCVAACTTVLSLDPFSIKALYRRARARIEPLSAGTDAVDAAIRDLTEAARISPDDRSVRELLSKLKTEKAVQREADTSTFARMFGRAEGSGSKGLADDTCRGRADRRVPGSSSLGGDGKGADCSWPCDGEERANFSRQGEADRTPNLKELEADVEQAAAVAQMLRSRGQQQAAKEIQARVKERRRQLTIYRRAEAARAKRGTSRIDFRNPTAKQREDARRRGIDLDDPLVLEELERLQRETPPELPPSSCRPVRHRSARPPPPDIHAIPLSEIKRRLDDLGVDRSSISDGDRAELEVLLLSQYSVARSSAGANVDLVNYQHSSLWRGSGTESESQSESRWAVVFGVGSRR